MTNAPEIIRELVEQFETNLRAYKSTTYKEEQLKHDFLNKFFKALGWDVYNERNAAPQHRDVIFEDSIKIGGGTKAPDYCFTLAGKRMFFVEAKKPSVDIKKDVHPAFQLRRYAWSAKLPLSILTDFEEFAVYETRTRPQKEDKAGTGRVMYLTYKDYIDQWDEIASRFSYDAVVQGYFDRFAETTEKKRGTQEVDSEFLKEIESWRELLAKNIALRNPEVSIYELNYAVQKIIDRIIFLRICEDRGIEPYGQLQTKAESGDVYTHLRNHFKLAESKYDSGIFDFDVDKITPALSIDDRVLKAIVQSLYYPKSPYEFSVLGVEILGNVYEQFLGKVIRLTAGHQAKVETKPEVKKAGGVYYTPQYIVDYIVKNTVGKLVEGKGKTPEEIAEIKILDPACGSGSFLIGAYTYLLRYHLDWYVGNEPKKHKEAVFQVRENEWYLTTAEKKRILLNNIFGVDIDPQAVEVTKLSLLLKVLEHESRESIDQQVKLGLEGVLPNLVDNVKCGNSLIGPDFYGTGQQETLFDEAEMRRVNVFDWDDERKGFGEIMKRGGFDAVIGNPPYVEFKRLDAELKKPIRERFESAKGKFDLFIPFIEQGIRILKEGGCISYICPSMFVKRDFGAGIRRFITDKVQIVKLTYLSDFQIFGKVTNYPIIFVFQKSKNIEKTKIELFTKTKGLTHAIIEKTLQENRNTSFFKTYSINSNNFSEEAWDFSTDVCKALRAKLETAANSKRLGELCKYIFEGIASGKDGVFYINSDVIAQFRLEKDIVYPLYRGENIGRYFSHWSDTWVIYPYDRETNKVISERELKEKYPNVYGYLQGKRDNLRGRKYFDRSNKKWYELWCERGYKKFKPSKIIVAEISPENRFCLDTEGFLGNTKTFNLVLEDNQTMNYKYLLGILNSKLLNFYHRLVSVPKAGGYFEYKTQFLSLYPIRTIDFSNPTEKAQHDKLVALVDNMLELQKKYYEARMEIDKGLYERQIKIVDAQIDRLVYDLYGLTEEEMNVVEGGI